MSKCQLTQGFYGNATSVYSSYGMKGHGAVDIVCGYGTPIESPLDGYVYKVIDDKRPANDGTGYWAVFMIVQYKGSIYELCIGHCSKINVDVGFYVKKGDVIALEGNRGRVFVGEKEITKAMQDKGVKDGSHRHWQLRAIKKTLNASGKIPRLTVYPLSIYKDKDGYEYEIPGYYNGFNGLVPEIADVLKEYGEWKNTVSPGLSTVPNAENIKQQLTLMAQAIELIKKLWGKMYN
jgi:murein DD-endopeptidase MepM/ murein hydrolase activator NlpD